MPRHELVGGDAAVDGERAPDGEVPLDDAGVESSGEGEDEFDVLKVGVGVGKGERGTEQLADGGARGDGDIVSDIAPAGVTPEVLAALTADDDGDLSDDDFEL
jgi:hypothetical protein